jgi:hypothetical protein
MTSEPGRAWIVSADMGYGHLRAVHPFRDIAEEAILSVGTNGAATPSERKLWRRMLGAYELLSRTRSIPVVGKMLFALLDGMLHIPSFYPIRNLSRSTFQVNLLASSIRRGLCKGILEKIRTKHLPLITSFYAPAIAADMEGYAPIYCIICDADLNRVWVAQQPWESRIIYFAPCGKAAQRLKAYGVPEERIFLSGFPLPDELLGGPDLATLKSDLGQRLRYLDPGNRFWPLHERNVEFFLGRENCVFRKERILTITYAVGGAGAQREFGGSIARSLRERIRKGEIRVNLVAGTKETVRDYFLEVKRELAPSSDCLQVYYAESQTEYFDQFTSLMHTTDILWTKPSELSFYSALGIPIIMSPTIGSQEKFNRQWLLEINAGIRQENPEYAHQWLFDALDNGRFAEVAWSGFLKARKLGSYRIREVLGSGGMTRDNSPLLR